MVLGGNPLHDYGAEEDCEAKICQRDRPLWRRSLVHREQQGKHKHEYKGREIAVLSLLQHIKQIQPGSPLRPRRTDKFLDESMAD